MHRIAEAFHRTEVAVVATTAVLLTQEICPTEVGKVAAANQPGVAVLEFRYTTPSSAM